MSKLGALKKSLEKKNIETGFTPITEWLSFDNLAMNWVCTGSFRRSIPHMRSVLIGGASGATKSMNALQLARKAQKKGYTVVLLDSETSISDQDLEMNGVDTSEEMFMPIEVTTHEDIYAIFDSALKSLEEDSKLMFILDSITGLMTSNEDENFDKAKKTNDMGRVVQENKALLKYVGNRVRSRDWFFVSTSHLYENQDFPQNGKPRYILSNVGAAEYFPSIVLELAKLPLKDGAEQTGIRVDVSTRKNRFFQVGKKVRLELPYENEHGGFDPYEGVLQILVDSGYVERNGAWYSFVRMDENGSVTDTVKFQSKNFSQHAEELIDMYEDEHAGVFDASIHEKDEDEASVEAAQYVASTIDDAS